MQINDIEEIIKKSRSLTDALHRITTAIDETNLTFMVYGFFVHLHNRDRNDSVFCHTCPDDTLKGAFLAAGGTATDVVATKIEHIKEPYPIDLVGLVGTMREASDFRLKYIEKILGSGVKTAWICTMSEPWSGGYGVFNQFYKDRYAESAIPVHRLKAFAEEFHKVAKQHRLISGEIGLRSSQVEFLSQVAMGKSAEDLAEKYQISSRAAEKRLERIRHKLRARNTVEAVYKATSYGVLPWPAPVDCPPLCLRK